MMTPQATLYLLTLLNSLVLDYRLRMSVSANLTMFFLYQLPVPRLPATDPRVAPLVKGAAQLVCTTPAYDALAAQVGLGDHTAALTDPAARDQVRAELDARVAHLYGLTEAEYEHVLASFPLVPEAMKVATLQAYRALLPHPDDEAVARLIAGGENRLVEFKEAAYCDPFSGKLNDRMLPNVVSEVASFLNSEAGGTVIVGVADKPVRVVGIASDFTVKPGIKTEDAYLLALSKAISDGISTHHEKLVRITFHTVEGVRVCRLNVAPADTPAYYANALCTRGAGGKLPVKVDEIAAFLKRRFPET